MTRDEIIEAQTVIQRKLAALYHEGKSVGLSDLVRAQEIQDETKRLNTEFKVLDNQRVTH